MDVTLIVTAYNIDELPKITLPAIAFVGRSNVGKSTLINKLLNRKNVARTSTYPGKTISINFYTINDKFIFIDLPGYGYARQSIKNIKKWNELIEYFFINYKDYLTLLLLIDVRRGITNKDLEMYNYIIMNHINYIPIITKTDKVNRNEVNRTIKNVSAILNYNDLIITYSYKDNQSLIKLWDTINKALNSD
jgi:GTP-binding protein